MWPSPDRPRSLVVTLGQSFICTAYSVAPTLGGPMELSLQPAGTRAKARRLGRALPDIGRKKRPPYSALSGVPVPNSRRWLGRALHSPFTCSYGTYLASQRGRIAASVHSLNVIQMDIPTLETQQIVAGARSTYHVCLTRRSAL